MNIEQKFRLYDRIIAVILGLIILTALLASCSTSRNAPYRDPVKSPDTYVRKPHSNCGWAYN